MRRIWRLSLVVALACVIACGGSVETNGSADGGTSWTVTGTVAGQSVPTTAAAAISSTSSSADTTLEIVYVNVSDICSLAQTNTIPRNSTAFFLAVTTIMTPVVPGTYYISAFGQGQGAIGQYLAEDAACAVTKQVDAIGGHITLTTVTGTQVQGAFDVMFPGGDQLSGSFSLPVCTVPPSFSMPSICGG
jgi:hypothetical protein